MKLYKILLTSFLLGVLSFSSVVAQAEKPVPVTDQPIATVNFTDTKIASQDNHTIRLHFTMTNATGVQTGVRYGVSLISTIDKKQVVVDEKVYTDSLTLVEKGSITKDIEYVAPSQLAGTYTVALTASNDSGFPFSYTSVGEVTLTSLFKGVSLVPGSCSVVPVFVSTAPVTVPVVFPAGSVTVRCTAVNASASVVVATPAVATYYRSVYGPLVSPEKMLTPISFAAKEKKTITLSLVPPAKPQAYQSMIRFVMGDESSNTTSVRYIVKGASATIQNVSVNKSSFVRGEVAEVQVVWSGSADADTSGVPDTTAFVVGGTIKNSFGMACAKIADQPITEKLFSGVTTIPVEIAGSCDTPTIAISLRDAQGGVLDTKTISLSATTSQDEKKNEGIVVPLIIVVLALFGTLFAYMKLKNHTKGGTAVPPQNTTTSIPPSLAIVIAVGLGALVSFQKVEASTFPVGIYGNAFATVSLPSGSLYQSGAPIPVDGAITSTSSAASNVVTLTVTTDGNPVVTMISKNLLQNETATKTDILTAPLSPGSYAAYFEATIDENPPYNPDHVFFVGSYRWGKIVYTGPANHTDTITVTVQLHGLNNVLTGETSTTGIHAPDSVFTIPAGTTNSYYSGGSGQSCGNASSGTGCEIEGTGGFMYGVVTGISSSGSHQLDSQPQLPFHVCRYTGDVPPDGNYFALELNHTCSEYPGSTQYQ